MLRFLAFVAVLMLATQTGAAATEPLQSRHHVDVDVPAVGASLICGFEIRVHIEGDTHFTVFYDNEGNIVREVDTSPSLKITVYRPGTDQSYTTASPAMLHTQYTDGAAVGSEATAELTGLLERIPGLDMDAGRLVFSAVVFAYDADGVPIIRGTGIISSAGPDLDAPIRFQRCAFFQ
jgi:hypothetical protein